MICDQSKEEDLWFVVYQWHKKKIEECTHVDTKEMCTSGQEKHYIRQMNKWFCCLGWIWRNNTAKCYGGTNLLHSDKKSMINIAHKSSGTKEGFFFSWKYETMLTKVLPVYVHRTQGKTLPRKGPSFFPNHLCPQRTNPM